MDFIIDIDNGNGFFLDMDVNVCYIKFKIICKLKLVENKFRFLLEIVIWFM